MNTIWTTNFDTIIEDCIGKENCVVFHSDRDLSLRKSGKKVEIIKMHGCINNYRDIVITQDDYDFYQLDHPNMCRELISDMSEKTFLFLGYSYRDPDVHSIIRTSQWNNRALRGCHFLLTKKEENNYTQEMWANNIKRYGIHVIFIDDYSQLIGILGQIAHKSWGKQIYITGSHRDNKFNHYAEVIGREIAKVDDVVLLDGQSKGIGEFALKGFYRECIKLQKDRIHRIKSFINPYAINGNLSTDKKLIPELKKYRYPLVREAQLIVMFDGGMGTKAEYELAKENNCIIFPIFKRKMMPNSKMIKDVLIYCEYEQGNKEIATYIRKIKNIKDDKTWERITLNTLRKIIADL